jgi:UDP-N-acetylglucosamine 1-carboxyvinyltransferase
MQPQFATLLTICDGNSTVVEDVWDNRFKYIDQLRRMGANIMVNGDTALITGVETLTSAPVEADDLRAGAAMVIAGLIAKGETSIGNIKLIDRGYENIVEKLTAVGADISRVTFDED